MILVVQPELMERVVFEAARADSDLERLYQRQFADCYKEAAPHARNLAFRALHEKWFDELGFHRNITAALSRFPNVMRCVDRAAFARAVGRNAQSMELFGKPGRYTAAACVAVSTLLDPVAFSYWAAHELLHIDDILDPDFVYDASLRPEGASIAATNRTRERYAVLWAISIDSRLARRGKIPNEIPMRRKDELTRSFGLTDIAAAELSFERLWTELGANRPAHPALVELARRGVSEHSQQEADDAASLRPASGSPCPICGFPTFDWADYETTLMVAALLPDKFSAWSPEHGICGRCAEVYRCQPVAIGSLPQQAGLAT